MVQSRAQRGGTQPSAQVRTLSSAIDGLQVGQAAQLMEAAYAGMCAPLEVEHSELGAALEELQGVYLDAAFEI